jgi:hypothetical protein
MLQSEYASICIFSFAGLPGSGVDGLVHLLWPVIVSLLPVRLANTARCKAV